MALRFLLTLVLAFCAMALPAARAGVLPLRGTLPDASMAAPSPMIFRLGRFEGSPGCGLPCAEFIYAAGELRPDSVEALLILQSRLKRPLPVYLDSPGGNLDGGLAIGRAIRSAGSSTFVAGLTSKPCNTAGQNCTEADQRGGITVYSQALKPGLCNSACVYAFAGGIRRNLAEGASLGVHRFFLTRADDPYRRPLPHPGKQDVARLDRTHDAIATYLTEMGVSADTLRIASQIEPHEIRHLSPLESAELNLTTPPNFAGLARTSADPLATGSVHPAPAVFAPSVLGLWPMVTRAGRPLLVVSQPSESRRFGRITTELAIGCAPDLGRYHVAFRELIVSRSDRRQDARVRVEPDETADLARHAPAPVLLRDTALKADERGVLVLEITSSATAGYPTRIEFPSRGLKDGIEKLDRACKRTNSG